jgi:hypothetical protein
MIQELARLRWTAVLLTVVAVAGCAGPGNERIAQVAQSGEVFAAQAPRVYDVAFEIAVHRDSTDLVKQRQRAEVLPAEAQAAVRQAFAANTRLLAERLEQFDVMKEHARLLRTYFSRLDALASGGGASAAGEAATNVAGELQKLVPKIEGITIGGSSVGGLVGPLVSLGVSTFTNARLQEHLEASGEKVREAIALQRAMFALLLKFEQDRARAAEEAAIKAAFDSFDKPLASDWAARRLKSFTPSPVTNALSAARDAAEQLQSNYEDLLTGGDGSIGRLQNALALVGAVVTVFETSRPQ